jgi:cytochrome c-type biogenesis protein CcmE
MRFPVPANRERFVAEISSSPVDRMPRRRQRLSFERNRGVAQIAFSGVCYKCNNISRLKKTTPASKIHVSGIDLVIALQRMTSTHKKLLAAGIVMGIAVGYLGFAGVKQGWVYYVMVDQYATDLKVQQQRVKLCGMVGSENLLVNAVGLRAQFELKGKSQSVKVDYHGVIPDLFQGGRDVVVEGKLDNAGVFQADMLMTKCASKYEAGKGHPPTE